MLLRALLDLATSRDLLADPAFTDRTVRYIIALDADGRMLGSGPQIAGDETRGRSFSCPATTKKKTGGGVAEFLVDRLTALFGLDPDPGAEMSAAKRADRDANNQAKMEDFWGQIQAAGAATGSASLAAILAFRRALGSGPPPFLRWGSKAGGGGGLAWWIGTAAGPEIRLGAKNWRVANFTFSVAGSLPVEDPKIRQFWRGQHGQELAAANAAAKRGLCLVTGEPAALLARTHDPAVRGVKGAQSAGAKLVSFEHSAPAFGSYGHLQALNAPVAISAARGYATALQWLVDQPDHHLDLGDTTICFWARDSEPAAALFARLLARADPQAVAQFLLDPWSGIERPPLSDDSFCAVSLAGNGGRIAVRQWLQVPLGLAADRLHRWFSDLDLTGPPLRPGAPPPLAIRQLAHCAAPLRLKGGRLRPDEDKLAPLLPSQLFDAALNGAAPPLGLAKQLLDQLQSHLLRDGGYQIIYDRSRFALLRLVLNRNRGTPMEIPIALTANTPDPAYNCGRLLAVLHAAQEKAHDFKLEGPSIAERYFGAASVSPGTVFPLLLRLNRHHLRKIAGSERYGSHARFAEEQVRAIAARFQPGAPGAAPDFPRHLDLHAQGRFALGFYQQAADDAARRRAAQTSPAGPEPGPAPED